MSSSVQNPQVVRFISQAELICQQYFTDSDPTNDIQGINRVQQIFDQTTQALGQTKISCELVDAYYKLQKKYQVLPPLHRGFSCQLQFGDLSQNYLLHVGDKSASPGPNTTELATFSQTHELSDQNDYTFGPFDSYHAVQLSFSFNSVNWAEPEDLLSTGGEPSSFIGRSRAIIVPGNYTGNIPEQGSEFAQADIQAWATQEGIDIRKAATYFIIINPSANEAAMLTHENLELKGLPSYKVIAQSGKRADPNHPKDSYDNFCVFVEAKGRLRTVDLSNPQVKIENPPVITQEVQKFLTQENPQEMLLVLAIDSSGSMARWPRYLSERAESIIQDLNVLSQGQDRFGVAIITYVDGSETEIMSPTYARPNNRGELDNLKYKMRSAVLKAERQLGGGHESFWETAQIITTSIAASKKQGSGTLIIALTDEEFHSQENINFDAMRESLNNAIEADMQITHLDGYDANVNDISFTAASDFRKKRILQASKDPLYIYGRTLAMLDDPHLDVFLHSQGVVSKNNFKLVPYGDQGVMLLPRDVAYLEAFDAFSDDLTNQVDHKASLTKLLHLGTVEDAVTLAIHCATLGEQKAAISAYAYAKLDYEHLPQQTKSKIDQAADTIFCRHGFNMDESDMAFWTPYISKGAKWGFVYSLTPRSVQVFSDYVVSAAQQDKDDLFWTLFKQTTHSHTEHRLAALQSFAIFVEQEDWDNAQRLSSQMQHPDDTLWSTQLLLEHDPDILEPETEEVLETESHYIPSAKEDSEQIAYDPNSYEAFRMRFELLLLDEGRTYYQFFSTQESPAQKLIDHMVPLGTKEQLTELKERIEAYATQNSRYPYLSSYYERKRSDEFYATQDKLLDIAFDCTMESGEPSRTPPTQEEIRQEIDELIERALFLATDTEQAELIDFMGFHFPWYEFE